MIAKKRIAKCATTCLLLISFALTLVGCYTEMDRPAYLPIPDVEPLATEEPKPTKRVALTFDDGPQHYKDQTKGIVDELEKYGYHATFFVVGDRVAGGDSVAYAIEKGNEIGIHGYTHEVYYDSCSEDDFRYELNMTEQEIRKQVPGYKINLMRPIGGKISADRVQTCPYSVIMWSVDSDDWNSSNRYYAGITDEECEIRVNRIVDNIMNSLKNGDIILMHDIYESTYDATKLLLKRLHEEGYDVVTVSELLGDNLKKGRIYYSETT
ncbi:MAG: polysaccharide deacetylase family protein [Clostridia bacterium]|nr:polysaccharide deacetylase family protein [Clostridia bacterium]